MTPEEFAAWTQRMRWQFAKTMAWVPHYYTLRKWNEQAEFDAARHFIFDNGYLATWKNKEPNSYYDLDGWRYWAYLDVINRQEIGSANSEVTLVPDSK